MAEFSKHEIPLEGSYIAPLMSVFEVPAIGGPENKGKFQFFQFKHRADHKIQISKSWTGFAWYYAWVYIVGSRGASQPGGSSRDPTRV